MCGYMRLPGLPKRMAGSNSFIARIAVIWACFKSDSEPYSMHCAKGYVFPSVFYYPWIRLQRHTWRTNFLYGSKMNKRFVLIALCILLIGAIGVGYTRIRHAARLNDIPILVGDMTFND